MSFTEESTSRTIQAYDTTIHYHDVGEGEPIVMLHAWGPGTTAWSFYSKVLPILSKKFRCIAIDSPNFAKTGPLYKDESLYFMQAGAAHALMEKLGLKKAHILGYSQGGQSALTFAGKYPEAVDRLIVGANHTGDVQGEYLLGLDNEEGIRVAYPALANPTPDNMRDYLNLCVVDKTLITDELIAYLIGQHNARPDIAAAREKMQYGPRYDLAQDMMNIKAPTLVIWGREDRTCTWEIGIRMFKLIPNSRLVVLKRTGHWAPFEKPLEFAGHVAAFLGEDWAEEYTPPPKR